MSQENENMSEAAKPEWATTLLGKLTFCSKCNKETMLTDGIREVCTSCGYENTKE